MCHDHYLRRRREADESRALWWDFDRTDPPEDADRPVAPVEPEPDEIREAIATAER